MKEGGFHIHLIQAKAMSESDLGGLAWGLSWAFLQLFKKNKLKVQLHKCGEGEIPRGPSPSEQTRGDGDSIFPVSTAVLV
jgi:hypothetical protein